jgi:hypothetical protein
VAEDTIAAAANAHNFLSVNTFHSIFIWKAKQQPLTMTSNNQASNTPPASNQLIVEFPSSSLSTPSESATKLKSVRFVSYCDVKLVEYTARSETRWYSEQDFIRFRKALIRDAVRCSILLRDILADEHDRVSYKDFATYCIGLEPLLSRDLNVLARHQAISGERKRHTRVVIKEHTRLMGSGSYSVERLASASRASSERARKRSRKFAALAASIQL